MLKTTTYLYLDLGYEVSVNHPVELKLKLTTIYDNNLNIESKYKFLRGNVQLLIEIIYWISEDENLTINVVV